jgi:hypothetical protein
MDSMRMSTARAYDNRQLALHLFLLYKITMGRPRGSKNTAMVNGRITAEQMEWLLARAEALGGNLSAALRQTITDARFLEMAREDYRVLVEEHPTFRIPRRKDGMSRLVDVVLNAPGLSEVADLELRDEEASREN